MTCPVCGLPFPYGDPRTLVPGRQCFDCDERDAKAVARVREHLQAALGTRVALDDATPAPAQVVEASTLGLAPGAWPLRLTHGGCLFVRDRVVTSLQGEVIEVHYRAPTGAAVLTVLND